jgi:hypothetical protein
LGKIKVKYFRYLLVGCEKNSDLKDEGDS